MSFWTNGDSGKDPKRNFRFKVTISGFSGENQKKVGKSDSSLVWYAKKVQKPNFTTANSKHVFMGHTFYWPGKTEWQEITMTLVDPETPNATAILYSIAQDSGFQLPDIGGDGRFITQSKSKSITALGTVTIEQLDAEGKSIETWTLKQPHITKISFSELDYENDDLTTIDIGFRYDWATCDTGELKQEFFNKANGIYETK